MFHIQKILYATDFSSYSNQAYFYAVTLAETFKASLTIVHVHASASEIAVTPEMVPIVFEEPPDVRKFWEDQLQQIRPLNEDIPVHHVLLDGHAAHEIIQFAQSGGFDLIVMGSHGRTGLASFVTGSIAQAVLKGAHCPVLVVKMPKPADNP